jgi:hypothetical protein
MLKRAVKLAAQVANWFLDALLWLCGALALLALAWWLFSMGYVNLGLQWFSR